MLIDKILLLTVYACSCYAQENLLLNPDFEIPVTNDDWRPVAADLTQDEDSYTGIYSCRVSNAREDYSAVQQFVDLKPNGFYEFSIMIKLLNESDPVLGEQFGMNFNFEEDGGTKYNRVGSLRNLRVAQGWQKLSGDFSVGDRDITEVRVNVQALNAYIEYLVDTASLIELPIDTEWRNAANQRIEDIRKNDINVNLQIAENYDPSLIQILVNQTSHEFPFGSAIKHTEISGTAAENEKYQDCFYENFNWAVMENKLKWKQMERNQDEIEFPDESIAILYQRGIPLRGHCVVWGVEERVPEWLFGMSPEEIMVEIDRRIDYVVPRYNQSIVHWDVYNEQEHGKWFENNTRNPNVMEYIFREVHARTPETPLFLNDFNIVVGGVDAQSYANTAQSLLAQDVPVHMIGIQSHFGEDINIFQVQRRLDLIADVGLPVWITELDVENINKEIRAQGYDDLVTFYFSHPSIYGILIWGFHDEHHWKPDAALFEGPDYTPNAAGLRWQEMIFDRWQSDYNYNPTELDDAFSFRGFYGKYEISVLYDGALVQTERFSLENGSSANIFIYVT